MRWVLCCPLSNTLAPLYSAPRAGQRILAVSTRVHPAGRLPARSQLLHGARRCLLLPSPLFYFLPLCRGPQACQEQPPLPLCCKFRFSFRVKALVLALGPVCTWERWKKKRKGGLRLNRPLYGQVRKVLSDFSSVLAILLGCGLDAFLGLDTPKLLVPTEFKVRAGQNEGGGWGQWSQQLWSNKLHRFRTSLLPHLSLHS